MQLNNGAMIIDNMSIQITININKLYITNYHNIQETVQINYNCFVI